MNAVELKQLQYEIRFDAPSMACCLGVPYQTYRNYIYGINKIPPAVQRAALELEQINKTFMVEAVARIDARIAKDHPHGIISEVTHG
jgi:hypothetical protein